MMNFVKGLVDTLFVMIERLKGTKVIHEIPAPPALTSHLSGYSISGYEIHFYCQKRRFRCTYHRWFFFNRTYTAFRVYSVVSTDAPTILREVCGLDLYLPLLVPKFLSERVQKEVAVQAYLDIVINRLQGKRFI